MNGNQQPRRNNKNPAAAAKGKGNSRGGRKRGNKKKTPRSAIDPKRPMWENKAGEAELAAIVGSVRPARNPSALVRSLGDPPLGKYASTAHHYYDAVYGKAQHFAIAIATANGLLVMDGDGDDASDHAADDDSGAEPRNDPEAASPGASTVDPR